jgi:hypothetical protein
MHGFFLFLTPNRGRRTPSSLLIFCALPQPTSDDLVECLRDYCSNNLSPERISILAPRSEESSLAAIINSEPFRRRLPQVTRSQGTPNVEIIAFDETGRSALDENVKRQALNHIFRKRDGLHESSPHHHYIKPNGDHSNRFLRTGSVLIDGAEILFIALCCLPFIKSETAFIYCDTGAIHSLAFAISSLRQRLHPSSSPILVTSFGSYEGLKTFRFEQMEKAMVLISASTSCKMEVEILKDPFVTKRDILTVFYLGEAPRDSQVVCNLLFEEKNPNGYEIIESLPSHRCKWCRAHSTPLQIAGDQFLPEGANVSSVGIAATDLPDSVKPFLRDTVGSELIRAGYFSVNNSAASKQIFFDLHKMLKSKTMLGRERFKNELERIFDQATPKAINRIIHLDDEGSKQMAGLLTQRCSKRTKVLSASSLFTNPSAHVLKSGATLVVAGAIASGRGLLGISQALRVVQPNSAITYVIGIARTSDSNSLRELRSNLTYGEGLDDFGFFTVEEVYLPVFGDAITSWDEEIEICKRLAISPEQAVVRFFSKRLEVLTKAHSKKVRGFRDDLFLLPPDSTPLSLRPGFAFFDFDYSGRSVSQADVFFTILSILHHMRTRRDGRTQLRNFDHVRTVLSPRCFDRFNDGVVQSALLRAATPAELDFRHSEKESGEMTEILRFIFSNWEKPAGEAGREFALALVLKRLRLSERDMKGLRKTLGQVNDTIMKALSDKITP